MFKNTIKNSQSDYSDTSHFFSINRLDTIFCFPAIFFTTFPMLRLDEFQFPKITDRCSIYRYVSNDVV